jgi:hypothetical protein
MPLLIDRCAPAPANQSPRTASTDDFALSFRILIPRNLIPARPLRPD